MAGLESVCWLGLRGAGGKVGERLLAGLERDGYRDIEELLAKVQAADGKGTDGQLNRGTEEAFGKSLGVIDTKVSYCNW